MAKKGWSRPFEDPIPLPRGRQLVTLHGAGTYIGVKGIRRLSMSGRGEDPKRPAVDNGLKMTRARPVRPYPD